VPHTLLLADDSVTIQRIIALTFADEDVDVVAVNDGDQAIERLESAPADIVLADVGMPGRNGYEVARYIKRSPTLSHIPVILLTGAFEPIDHLRASEAGCDGVLQKPFEPRLVVGRVMDLLTSRRPASPPPEAAPTPLAMPDGGPGVSARDQSIAEPPAPTGAAPELDDYFERLDAALAGLGVAPARPSQPAASEPPESSAPPAIDWFAPGAESPAAAVFGDATGPAVDADGAPAVATPATSSDWPASMETEASGTSTSPSRESPALPSIADAFAALLEAEQRDRLPASAPPWPAPAPSDDALVEKVTRRVLAQLSDRVVRETVAEVVSQVAERLVREEIERIKAAMQ
jgi:CheY-like chemotaxis protein